MMCIVLVCDGRSIFIKSPGLICRDGLTGWSLIVIQFLLQASVDRERVLNCRTAHKN